MQPSDKGTEPANKHLVGCITVASANLQAMKVNAKLSGVNVSLISRPAKWMDEPFMVLGELLSEPKNIQDHRVQLLDFPHPHKMET